MNYYNEKEDSIIKENFDDKEPIEIQEDEIQEDTENISIKEYSNIIRKEMKLQIKISEKAFDDKINILKKYISKLENDIILINEQLCKNNKLKFNKIIEEPDEEKFISKLKFIKNKNKDKDKLKKYKKVTEEVEIKNLEDYILKSRLDVDQLSEITYAISNNIEDKHIVNFIENELSPKQIRNSVDLIIAKNNIDKKNI